uniref:Uncharacterized protein n=1 Tax=Anguilla anguilla TaxID=7936 RepID=A0A0E9RYY8_ANGAN
MMGLTSLESYVRELTEVPKSVSELRRIGHKKCKIFNVVRRTVIKV